MQRVGTEGCRGLGVEGCIGLDVKVCAGLGWAQVWRCVDQCRGFSAEGWVQKGAEECSGWGGGVQNDGCRGVQRNVEGCRGTGVEGCGGLGVKGYRGSLTIHSSQQVELFHSLIFIEMYVNFRFEQKFCLNVLDRKQRLIEKLERNLAQENEKCEHLEMKLKDCQKQIDKLQSDVKDHQREEQKLVEQICVRYL